MAAWWEALPWVEQIFFLVALPSTAILLIQTILLMLGGDHGAPDTGLDSDVSGFDGAEDLFDSVGEDPSVQGSYEEFDQAGLRIFTVRGILAFLSVAGWIGILMVESGAPAWVVVLVPILAGSLALYGIAKLMQSMMKLQESGNLDYRRALGKTAEVYLTIPAEASGQGKITVTLQTQVGEFSAVSHDPQAIKTGQVVRIVDVVDDVFVVEREKNH